MLHIMCVTEHILHLEGRKQQRPTTANLLSMECTNTKQTPTQLAELGLGESLDPSQRSRFTLSYYAGPSSQPYILGKS